MHNIVIWYFYTLQNNRHKSSYHLSPYKVITMSLIIFPVLYILSPWLIYFVIGSLYLLIFLTYFTHLPTPASLVTTYLFSASASLFLFCLSSFFVFLHSTYKWNHTVLLFAAWLFSHSIIPSRSIHAVANGKVSFFFTPLLFHSFISGHLGCFHIMAIL